MEAKWYAVYTKSRWEKKVADQFNKANIENYCPLNRVVKQWSDRKKVVEEPLFTSYVFVKITERQMTQVRMIMGVVNFVYWLGKPAVILPAEIQTIQEFLMDYFNVKLESVPLHVRDTVRILNGPFTEMQGNVISVKKKSVRVLLPSLRFFMTAEVEIENVAKV
ncbi:UpxY family transcription antiterminator [Arcticibacter sp.]|uniref:UpxY family transcription antiterminator n=1 Tax=Arcticibacter sp. TaxID=1872630 RepID=UPI00388FF668